MVSGYSSPSRHRAGDLGVWKVARVQLVDGRGRHSVPQVPHSSETGTGKPRIAMAGFTKAGFDTAERRDRGLRDFISSGERSEAGEERTLELSWREGSLGEGTYRHHSPAFAPLLHN